MSICETANVCVYDLCVVIIFALWFRLVLNDNAVFLATSFVQFGGGRSPPRTVDGDPLVDDSFVELDDVVGLGISNTKALAEKSAPAEDEINIPNGGLGVAPNLLTLAVVSMDRDEERRFFELSDAVGGTRETMRRLDMREACNASATESSSAEQGVAASVVGGAGTHQLRDLVRLSSAEQEQRHASTSGSGPVSAQTRPTSRPPRMRGPGAVQTPLVCAATCQRIATCRFALFRTSEVAESRCELWTVRAPLPPHTGGTSKSHAAGFSPAAHRRKSSSPAAHRRHKSKSGGDGIVRENCPSLRARRRPTSSFGGG